MLSISSPSNNQNFTEGANIPITFTEDGSVTEIEIYKNGALLASLQPPFSYTWQNAAAALDTDALIHYRFDGTVVDYSPTERDPIIMNRHNAEYVSGIKGSGAISLGNFVNSTERSYILIPSTPLMRSVATELTIMYWFKGSPSLNHSIFCTAAPENKGIHIVTLAGDGRTDFYINQNEVGNANRLRSSPTTAGELIEENVWKHFAWTYDGNVIRCYINGVLSNSRTVGPLNFGSDADWLINSNENSSRGDGEYDDFRIYGYAVTEGKILEVYNDIPSDIVELTAKGQTSSGWIDSDPVNVIVSKPNRPPVIKVLSPHNASTFEKGDNIPIMFICGDPDGEVDEVTIHANGQPLGVLPGEPWEYVWLQPSIGDYQVEVVAKDDDGLNGYSSVLDIYVTPMDTTPRIIKQNQVATIVTGADIDMEDDPDRPRYALDDAARAKQVAVGKEEEHIRPDSSIVRVPGRISERFEVDIFHPRPYVSGESLTFRSELYTRYSRISNMREGWFSVSFYWDANQVPDKDDETVFQWHVVPLYSTPFFSAAVRNGRLNWQVRWQVSGFANTMQFNMGAHPIGEWDDYIFYIKLSETGEGRFKLWRNRKLARTYHPYTGELWKVPTTWEQADAETTPLSHVATPDKGSLPITVFEGDTECSVVDWYGKTCYSLPAVVDMNRKWGLYKHGWNYVDPEDPLSSGTDTTNRVLRIANMKFTNANAPAYAIFKLLDADGLEALEGIDGPVTIIDQPDPISFVGNLPDILVTSIDSSPVAFEMKIDGETVLQETYRPDVNGNISIQIRDFINGQLSIQLPEEDLVIQNQGVKDIVCTIGGESIEFRVIKGGIDIEDLDNSGFIQSNWLTWQPQSKIVKLYDPEWLSYYASSGVRVRAKGYFSSAAAQTVTAYTLDEDNLYTINVGFSKVAGLFAQQPNQVEIWVETLAGASLTPAIRYILTDEYFEYDDVFVFENSLGGIDTIRFTGQKELINKFRFDFGIFYDELQLEYDMVPDKAFEKNTGYFHSKAALHWSQDFFSSMQKYIVEGGRKKRILTTQPEITDIKYQLSSFDFNFIFTKKSKYLSPM